MWSLQAENFFASSRLIEKAFLCGNLLNAAQRSERSGGSGK
jgi:hypothetical protein